MKSILDQVVSCIKCSWIGSVGELEPDINGDGDFGCPNCGTMIVVDENSIKAAGSAAASKK